MCTWAMDWCRTRILPVRCAANFGVFSLLLLLLVLVIAASGVGSTSPAEHGVVREYCQFEYLNASCPAQRLILMKTARYGRLQEGRCVTRDYGFVGCSATVLDLVDRECSGRRSCQFSVPALRDLVQPCPNDLTAYLEAGYECVQAVHLNGKPCERSISLSPTNQSVYISNRPASLSQLPARANKPCPLSVTAVSGQRMNFTLYSFGPHRYNIRRKLHVTTRDCSTWFLFREGNDRATNVSLCEANQRIQTVYTSHSNHVQVDIRTTERDATDYERFLLKIDVSGCPDLLPPVAAWVERHKDRAVVRCNYTHETWYMTCTGTAWTGTATNCSQETPTPSGEKVVTKHKQFPFGLVVAVTIGVILGVMFGIAMLVTVFVYRKKRKRQSQPKSSALLAGTNIDDGCQENEENYARRMWQECKYAESPYGRICRSHATLPHYYGTDCNHVIELQCSTHALPPPQPVTTAATGHRVEGTYGQCGRRPAHQCAKTTETTTTTSSSSTVGSTLHPCSVSLPTTFSNSASPTFATFKAPERLQEASPQRQRPAVAIRPGARERGVYFDKAYSVYSAEAAETEALTSPDLQPDLVTSNHIESGTLGEEPAE